MKPELPVAAPRRPATGGVVRAVIDVGTNSVKLLVGDVHGHEVRPLHETSHTTRLGRGFYETQLLQPEPIRLTVAAIGDFAAQARQLGAISLRVVATSAARDAKNPAEFLKAVRDATGLEVEIVSGEQEADWVFRGVTTDPGLAAQTVVILDVGGGSTEFILGERGEKKFRGSFNLGAVRLFETLRPADPPSPDDFVRCREFLRAFLQDSVAPALKPALELAAQRPPLLVGVGGTATVLAAMQTGLKGFDRDRLEGFQLSRADVDQWLRRLWSLSLAARREIPGLPPKRADVILTGAAIYAAVMEQFGFASVRVSTRGLRYAAILEPL
ncbi:MAG: Ppx/GppA family phosphatase [Verrucomicrobia bacterium]|nr:Ppx/GppA family phosphatase [Verrucomicrobiota bacterium]